MSSLIVSLAVLAITASSLARPTGRATLFEDLKANIKTFSPYQSAVIVTAQTLDLIKWRLTNIAEIHASLWALAGFHFYVPGTRSIPSELSHGLLVASARRVFLVGIVLPLYVFLLGSPCHFAIKWPMTFLFAEAAMIELSACYLNVSCAGVVLRTDWPRYPIFRKRFFSSGPCPGNHVQEAGDATTVDNNEENCYEHNFYTTGENLCERVRRIWSPNTRPNQEILVGRHPLEEIPNIVHVTSHIGPVLIPWTCGHWRCFVFMLLRVLVRALLYSVMVVDFGLAAWFLHENTQAGLIRISRILLSERIVNDLLTLTWLSAFCFLMGKAIDLVLVLLVFWIFRNASCLQRFTNLFQRIPPALKAVGRTIVFFISLFLSWSISQVLMKRDPILTDSILSYSIELLMMLRIALSVYRRLLVLRKPTTQKHDATQFDCAPGDLPPTGKTEEADHSEYDKNEEKARILSALAKFRLTILLPNVAIWIFRWWLTSAAVSGP
jgi:hypothetical protein